MRLIISRARETNPTKVQGNIMATTSSFCKEEEDEEDQILNAAADPGSDELAGSAGVAKQEAEEIKPPVTKKKKKKKKKVVRRMPQPEVDYVLSYEVESDGPDMDCFEEEYPYMIACFRALEVEMAELREKQDERMVAKQKDYRRQLRTKGYVTYVAEIEVSDEEEEEEEAPAVVPRGRRRFRNGVLKRRGRITKLN